MIARIEGVREFWRQKDFLGLIFPNGGLISHRLCWDFGCPKSDQLLEIGDELEVMEDQVTLRENTKEIFVSGGYIPKFACQQGPWSAGALGRWTTSQL